MNPAYVRLLYDYNAWANQRALDACGALSAEQFTRDLASSFPSLSDTLVHIFGAGRFWLERWHGSSPQAVPNLEASQDIASIRAWGAEIDGNLREFVSAMTADDLDHVLHYTTTEGKPNSQPVWQMLQHLANHSTYHRGQVTTLLRQLGATPASTDLSVYFREGKSQLSSCPIDAEQIRLLYEYDSWANRRAVEACASLSEEQFARDLHSSFPSVRSTLAHIMAAEWIWLERWQGRSPPSFPDDQSYRTPDALATRWREVESNLLRFVAVSTQEGLNRSFDYRNIKGQPFKNQLWETMLHVVNHSTYHRGQVATMIRQLGGKPDYTDLIYFYRERAGQALN